MKNVLSPSQVAHAFANQTQDSARNSGNTFYFNGDTIYSYGGHFPIAKHVNGKLLFTMKKYSNTTAKHISEVRSACSHLDKILCFELPSHANRPFTSLEHGQNQTQWVNVIKSSLNAMKTARKKEKYFAEVQTAINEANEYLSFFKIKPSKELKPLLAYTFEDGLKYAKKLRIAQEKESKVIETKGKKAFQLYVDLFHQNFSGEQIRERMDGKELDLMRKYSAKHPVTLLKVVGKEVITSKEIRMSFPVACRYIKSFFANQLKIGSNVLEHAVKSISPEHLEVGCHYVPLSEILYIQAKICK